MNRRDFVATAGLAASAGALMSPQAAHAAEGPSRVPLLANDYVVVHESPNPATVYCYTPGLCRLQSGRLVATLDLGGPGAAALPDVKRGTTLFRGLIYTSDDRGKTWTFRARTPMIHARPFEAGGKVYVLGHSGDLTVVRSDDGGETWSEAAKLTQGEGWHQSACNVHFANGKVYLVMEVNTVPGFKGWAVSCLAPVLMSAPVTADLTRRESWTFASRLVFRDAVKEAGEPNLCGVPFYNPGPTYVINGKGGRNCNPIGWLETNVVQFVDPNHIWCDPTGHTFHLLMRAHTAGVGLACMAKVTEAEDGSMTTSLQTAPSGKTMLYVPMPGGQMRFHILYDEGTKLYWLLSSQATDSMIRPEKMPPDRFDLPNNERHRLALHFSRNCVDWCFAGMVAMGASYKQARHYASMVIDGDDLHVLSRSGDERALSAHDGNLITFHTVRNFRDLVY